MKFMFTNINHMATLNTNLEDFQSQIRLLGTMTSIKPLTWIKLPLYELKRLQSPCLDCGGSLQGISNYVLNVSLKADMQDSPG